MNHPAVVFTYTSCPWGLGAWAASTVHPRLAHHITRTELVQPPPSQYQLANIPSVPTPTQPVVLEDEGDRSDCQTGTKQMANPVVQRRQPPSNNPYHATLPTHGFVALTSLPQVPRRVAVAPNIPCEYGVLISISQPYVSSPPSSPCRLVLHTILLSASQSCLVSQRPSHPSPLISNLNPSHCSTAYCSTVSPPAFTCQQACLSLALPSHKDFPTFPFPFPFPILVRATDNYVRTVVPGTARICISSGLRYSMLPKHRRVCREVHSCVEKSRDRAGWLASTLEMQAARVSTHYGACKALESGLETWMFAIPVEWRSFKGGLEVGLKAGFLVRLGRGYEDGQSFWILMP